MSNKIITKEIEKRLEKYPLYSQEGKGEDATVVLKVFNPYGSGTWLITEGDRQENGDYLLFGYCTLDEAEWEWGYILLSELESIYINVYGCQLPLEREWSQSNGHYKVKDLL